MQSILNSMINVLVPAIRWGIPLGIVFLIGCVVRRMPFKKSVFWTLLGAYIGALIGETILSGHKYATALYQLVPFNSVISGLAAGKYSFIGPLLLNVLLFIPMGMFICLGKRKVHAALVIGFTSSLLIEIAEIVTKTGVFDTDDLIMNTLGALLGFCITRVIQKAVTAHEYS